MHEERTNAGFFDLGRSRRDRHRGCRLLPIARRALEARARAYPAHDLLPGLDGRAFSYQAAPGLQAPESPVDASAIKVNVAGCAVCLC